MISIVLRIFRRRSNSGLLLLPKKVTRQEPAASIPAIKRRIMVSVTWITSVIFISTTHVIWVTHIRGVRVALENKQISRTYELFLSLRELRAGFRFEFCYNLSKQTSFD